MLRAIKSLKNVKINRIKNRASVNWSIKHYSDFNGVNGMGKETIIKLLENIGNRREVELYLNHFQNLQSTRFAVIKVGGAVLQHQLKELTENLAFLKQLGLFPIVLHGAGPQLNNLLEQANIEPQYHEGIRITDSNTLKLVREVFKMENLKLVESLENSGIKASSLLSGVFTGDYLDKSKYGFVGKILDVNKNVIDRCIETGSLPILTSMAETLDGQLLNVNADVAASMLARVIEPLKVIYLNDKGGMVHGDTKQVIDTINLDEEYEHYLSLPWVKYGTKLKLVQIKELLDHLPRSSSVAITDAINLKKELFTINGAGTLIRRGFRIIENNINEIDMDRVRNLMQENDYQVKKGQLSIARYLHSIQKQDKIYHDDNYQIMVIISQLSNIQQVPYLQRIINTKESEWMGLLDQLWDKIKKKHEQLYWISPNQNDLSWHFDRCEGSFKYDDFTLFWYGIKDINLIKTIINQLKDISNNEQLGVPKIPFINHQQKSSFSTLAKRYYSIYNNNNKDNINIGIIGARGYTGQEIINLLNVHPNFNLKVIGSRQDHGKILQSYKKEEIKYELINENNFINYEHIDSWILALPNGLSNKYVNKLDTNSNQVILDLSADNRFDNNWLYGLPELYPKDAKSFNFISNPGCYATAGQLGILPLLKYLENDRQKLVCNPALFGVSGYSGAGTTPSDKNNIEILKDNLLPYSLNNHIHEKEMGFHLNQKVMFTPHVASFFRGISMTIKIPLPNNFKGGVDDIIQFYQHFYKDHNNIQVSKDIPYVKDIMLKHGAVVGGFHLNNNKTCLSLVVTLDNLLKGAATQAIQSLNLRFGYNSLTGIPGF